MPERDPGLYREPFVGDAFARMFVACLFMFDLRINGLDLLPDVFGWIMVALALYRISHLHRDGRSLIVLSMILGILSLFSIYRPREPRYSGFHVNVNLDFIGCMSLIDWALMVVFIWRLCGMIADMARALLNPAIEQRAESRRRMYVGVCVTFWMIFGLAILGVREAELMMPLTIAWMVFALVVLVLLALLLRDASRMCRGQLV